MAFKTAEDAAAVAICCSGILLSVPPVLCRTQKCFWHFCVISTISYVFGSGHETKIYSPFDYRRLQNLS